MTPDSPLYPLRLVREAAKKGRVSLSRKAQRDYQELGYALEDVHACVADLHDTEYRGVAEYNGIQYDVYHPRFKAPSGYVDELYVKLSGNERATLPQITIVSFHLQRKG